MSGATEGVRHHLSTLKGRLVLGSFTLLALMGAATWIGYATVERLTRGIEERFSSLEQSTSIGVDLEGLIMRQIAVGEEYLSGGDAALEQRFAELGRQAHELPQRYKELPDLTSTELKRIEAVQELHAEIEVDYALASALHDGGRVAEARAMAAGAPVADLQKAIRQVTGAQAARVADAAVDLQRTGRDRQDLLLVVLTLALGLGSWIMYAASRGITIPLERLMGAANQLGSGDLRVQLDGKMVHEFDAVAGAFNTMAAQLRTFVQETMSIAEQISTSAFDLSSISEEVAASSGEVASAMVEITRGAESQSNGLQATAGALEEMGRRTQDIAVASQQVSALSDHIHRVASESRQEVNEALQMLLEIRNVVQTSELEVRDLDRASSQIDRFVVSISTIARQTNLLALNAAIEAARAGEHGRGFAVVAEEVRKLADGSAQAAQEVAQVVEEIRAKIREMVGTMERGSREVAGVEEVSRTASSTLEDIVAAVHDIRRAAGGMAEAVGTNQEAMRSVEEGLLDVSGTAESHAASAEQVAAAAQEQSAATEEMSAASAQMLQAAERMKELVSGLRA